MAPGEAATTSRPSSLETPFRRPFSPETSKEDPMSRLRLMTLASLALLLGASPGRVVRGDDIPATAKRLLEEHDKKVKEIKRKAEEGLKASRKKLLEDLQALETS